VLTFFTTAKPFRGHSAIIQRNALQSWKRLHPAIEIILFGNDPGAAEVCAELSLRREPNIVVNPSGTKRLDSIFGPAQQIARHDLLCYCNCDIILTRDFRSAIEDLSRRLPRFLMLGRRWDTDITTPIDFSRPDWDKELLALARSSGIQRAYHNMDYFVFARGLYTEIPPFVIGRVGWDPWLVGKAHSLAVPVVDVSDRVCAIHQNHDYGYHPQGIGGVCHDEEARRNEELSRGIRWMTIEDASYRLTAEGFAKNRFGWLAPVKRRSRDFRAALGGTWRTWVWHPLLNWTRPLRRALGLRQSALPAALRSPKRRHSMDR